MVSCNSTDFIKMKSLDYNLIGEKLVTEFPPAMPPATRKRIIRLMQAAVDRQQLGGDASYADSMLESLRAEFQPGAVVMILERARRAASKMAERERQQR